MRHMRRLEPLERRAHPLGHLEAEVSIGLRVFVLVQHFDADPGGRRQLVAARAQRQAAVLVAAGQAIMRIVRKGQLRLRQ